MEYPTMLMDYALIHSIPTYREEKFRIPSPAEKRLGLWVDRVGKQTSTGRPERLRILGQYCFIYVLQGAGVYLSETAGKREISEGDCMVQFPEDPCLYYPHDSWTTCWVTWNGPEGGVLAELGCLSPQNAVFPDPGAAALEAYAALLPIIYNEDINAVLRRKAIVLEMIQKCYSAARSTDGAALREFERMERAVAWLHDHFREEVRTSEIAARFHLSESHFRRRFRAYTGRSPSEFIRSLRMAESKRLLREGAVIKNVAREVGYRDVFYFMRVFKKKVGMPPGEFQKM